MALSAERIINGTWGEVWLDGEKMAEAYALQAKIDMDKDEIVICGKMGTDTKLNGYKGKGTIKIRKVNSRLAIKLSDQVKQGIAPRCQILSVLNDPAAYGAERVMIKDACFDDLTLADWEAKKPGDIDVPFTFSDWEFLDVIEPKD